MTNEFFKVTSVNYNYDFELGEVVSISVAFECQLAEIHHGVSVFAGTIQLPIDEASEYSIKQMDKAVKVHIGDRLLGNTQAPEKVD